VDDVLLAPDDGADEAGARVLDHEVFLGLDLRRRLLLRARVDQVVVGRTRWHPGTVGTSLPDGGAARRNRIARDTPGDDFVPPRSTAIRRPHDEAETVGAPHLSSGNGATRRLLSGKQAVPFREQPTGADRDDPFRG
jgi:hypothetical protein